MQHLSKDRFMSNSRRLEDARAFGDFSRALRTKTHLSSREWWYWLPRILGWRFVVLIQNMKGTEYGSSRGTASETNESPR